MRSCVNSARPVSRCENPAGPYFEPLPDWQYKAGIAPRGIVIAPGDTIIPQIANRGTPQDGGFYKDATRCAVNHIYRSAAVTLLAVATTIGAAHAQTESLDIRTGVYRGQRVTYQVINGLAVVEGDIILGTPEELEPPSGPQVIKEPDARQKAVATSDPETLWPEGVVPYTIDGGLPEPQRVLDAIEHWHDNTLIPELCTDSLCECGCVRSGLTAVVRWELGNWSFGFSVPGFPSRPESASAKPRSEVACFQYVAASA